jgi:hypothetical protein
MRGPFTIPGELLQCSSGFSFLSGTGGHLSFLMRIHAGTAGCDGLKTRASSAMAIVLSGPFLFPVLMVIPFLCAFMRRPAGGRLSGRCLG